MSKNQAGIGAIVSGGFIAKGVSKSQANNDNGMPLSNRPQVDVVLSALNVIVEAMHEFGVELELTNTTDGLVIALQGLRADKVNGKVEISERGTKKV